jgi:hypothetical protein
MKTSNTFKNCLILFIGLFMAPCMYAQTGQTEIEYDSDGSNPTLRLSESEDNDFSRLFFSNTNNATDRWALAARTGTTSSQLMGWYYNGAPRVYYTESDRHLNILGTGFNGIKLEGDNSGDTRLWITNGGGSHFLFDDDSDGHTLKLQAADDFAINVGGTNEKFSIDGGTGKITLADEATVTGKLTANNDVELRGSDPVIDFWNPSPPGIGAQIKFDENSSSGGNNGDLEIRNYQVAGEIELYTSTTNLNLRMNDTNIYSYEPFSPWTHKTTDLGLNGKAWDNVYYDDLMNQGAAAFVNRKVTEELLNYPPTEKKPGDFDYMTERGEVELDPNTLPPGLGEENAIITDEMVSYNFKANYEQQQQIEILKTENAELKAQIAEILKMLEK